MKVLLIQYHHYIDVVFPRLAEEFSWPVKFRQQFQSIIIKYIGATYYRLTRKQMKQAVAFCKYLANNPTEIIKYC